jgi:hypothetical protein
MRDFEYEEASFKTVDARRRNRLNGWRRLWLVLTCLALVAALWGSAYIGLETNNSPGSWDYSRSLEAAIENPGCASFLTTPFNDMKEPDFSSPCWYIYTTRSYDREAPLPYSMERHYSQNSIERWEAFGIALAILIPMVLIGSALVYLAGWLVAWIRRGFRQA